MNSRATSVTSLRLYQSAITACLVFWRKNCHPAIWDFYNKIGTKRTFVALQHFVRFWGGKADLPNGFSEPKEMKI
jgi:hypothetical protein